jgi:signal transduction histidine kinase
MIAPAVTWLTSGASILSLVDEACDAVERIVTIVKSLKTYTYLDRAPVQNVDIHEGLESTLVMMRGRLGRGVKITRDYAPSLPRIEAYSSELNQVWTNLIDNAAAAMGGEGELTIRTHQEGEEIVVEVSDTGPGIAPESLPLVFDPFFTTKPMGEGTGLGLNISHNIIVDKHRGEISVTSVPGNTTFTVKVPLSLPVEGKA